jgi:hypothetical protein
MHAAPLASPYITQGVCVGYIEVFEREHIVGCRVLGPAAGAVDSVAALVCDQRQLGQLSAVCFSCSTTNATSGLVMAGLVSGCMVGLGSIKLVLNLCPHVQICPRLGSMHVPYCVGSVSMHLLKVIACTCSQRNAREAVG